MPIEFVFKSTKSRDKCGPTVYTTKTSRWEELKQMFFNCERRQTWKTFTMTLQEAGVLSNAAACHVTSESLQLYSLLCGELEIIFHRAF